MLRKLFTLFMLILAASPAVHADASWKALWINREQTQSMPNEWLCFKKIVEVATVPASAVARIAADSKYWLWINGRLAVFEGGLKRGPEPGATYYDEVDIAPFLEEGENTIAVLVWHFGRNGFSHSDTGTAALLFDCQTPEMKILSDRSWCCETYSAYQTAGPPYPNFRLPESSIRFDARMAMDGWQTPGSDWVQGRAMMVADPGKPPFGKLVRRPIPMWKDYGLKEYEKVERIGDTIFCALPYNCQVTPWFNIEARAGQEVVMLTDNFTAGNGSGYSVRGEYIAREGAQEYENLGWMNGEVVKYVVPHDVKVNGLKYRETGYDCDFVGSFTCSDPYFDELWTKAARTLYVNMRDTYFDCPERERAQWWGDVVNELAQTFYAFDTGSYELTEKAIRELMSWQRADGVIFAPVPAGNWTRELPQQMLASVGWYGFYTHYLYSGDDGFIREIYPALHRYLHEVWQMGEDGLVACREGEWRWGDWGDNIDLDVLENCWYYLALKAEKEFAASIGAHSDIPWIEQCMTGIEQNFNRRFWTGSAYRSPGYNGATDDRTQAMAVLSGLAGEDKYPLIAEILQKEFHAGPYMERFILEALFDIGRDDLALQRMKERYRNMIGNEYSTLFEVWSYKSTPTDNNTNNHAWSGGPLYLLSSRVCGLRPLSPGFRTFEIAPQMGFLTEASAHMESACGPITASVSRRGDALTITVEVPAGTSAEVAFPSGKRIGLAPGKHTVKGK